MLSAVSVMNHQEVLLSYRQQLCCLMDQWMLQSCRLSRVSGQDNCQKCPGSSQSMKSLPL